MSEDLYFDLKIINGDFVLDSGAEPVLCKNRESIEQDIKHALIESGLVHKLVGERSMVLQGDIQQQMELLIESDDRIVPGTVFIKNTSLKILNVTATSREFGDIDTRIDL